MFLTVIREKKDVSLQKYILLGFIEYHKKVKMYSIEPFLLEIKDGITIEDAFEQWFEDTMEPCYNIERNIDASIWVVSNLYQIIDTVNSKKELKHTASVKREVVSQTIASTKEGEFRVSKESKYKYLSNKNGANGTKKAPHVRRTHNRHYNIKDEDGNIIGEKVITIREMRIHADKENVTTIKLLPNEDNNGV